MPKCLAVLIQINSTRCAMFLTHDTPLSAHRKSNMTFSTFVMASGRIIGEGSDVVGAFILHGTYEPDGRNFV